MTDPAPRRPAPNREPRHARMARALARHLARIERKLEAMRGDLAEAERAPALRRSGEAILAYLRQVPARASAVELPDPAEPSRTLAIALDPAIAPQANAARYFKRAAKAERGLEQIPPRIAAVEAEVHAVRRLLERLDEAARRAEELGEELRIAPDLARDLESALAKLPPGLRRAVDPPARGEAGERTTAAGVARGRQRAPSARLQPYRFRTREGWDVLVGRTNEGNDYLTHTLARPEDYWFHVHGYSGSHVVLRRGKGKNEPSKATLAEVGAWAAYYSKARTAGKVPVIWTLKKYVRKPRRSPAGLAVCEREKTLIVRPVAPGPEAMADAAEREGE